MKSQIITKNFIFKSWDYTVYRLSVICVLLIFQMVFVAPLSSYTYRGAFDQFGDNIVGLDAGSAAKGGTSIAITNNPLSVFGNPAGVFADRGMFLFTSGIVSTFERRVHYDNDSTTALNDNMFFDFSGIGIIYPVKRDKLTVAFAESAAGDYNYTYEEELRSPAALLTNLNAVDSEGGLRRAGFSVAYNPLKSLLTGISIYNLYGSPENTVSSTTYSTAVADRGTVVSQEKDILKHEFSGTALAIGALYHISGRTRMGLSYKPGFEMTDKTKLTEHTLTTVTKTGAKYKFKYPESLSLGLSFRFPGPSEPTLFFDVVHTNWSEARAKTGSGKWIDCGYVDTMEWHIGAEHTAKSKKFRYGLAFLPDYSRKGSQKAVVSCGLGFKIWVIDFDVSGQYFMRRNTLEDRLFHVPEDDPDFARINFEITDEYTKRFLFTGKIKL